MGSLVNPVSWVDVTSDHPVLMVEGNPFLYLGSQLSPHRLLHFGWEWADMERLFQLAAENHVTVLAVPLLWNWVEETRGQYDWNVLDTFLTWANRYGVRVEILWFGSNVCGKSLPPEGTPQWALDNFTKIKGPDGTLYLADDFCYASYRPTRFYKLDVCDANLLVAEACALRATFDHIGAWQADTGGPAVVIGAQILNEPTCVKLFDSTGINFPTLDRSYSDCANQRYAAGGYTASATFNRDMFWNYLNTLCTAVKQSAHPVWTRVNLNKNYEDADFVQSLIEKNEAMRVQNATNLDFIGDDPYADDPEAMFCFGKGMFATGKNLPMIMENDAAYPDTVRLIFNAMAGGSAYNAWELISSGDPAWQTGFYTVDHSEKRLIPKAHQQDVSSFFAMLRQAPEALAQLRADGGQIAYLNRAFLPNASENTIVGSIPLAYHATGAGGGIALVYREQLVLMSTQSATFRIQDSVEVAIPAFGCVKLGR